MLATDLAALLLASPDERSSPCHSANEAADVARDPREELAACTLPRNSDAEISATRALSSAESNTLSLEVEVVGELEDQTRREAECQV